RLYVVPGRPAWDSPLTVVRFFATALALGPPLTGHPVLGAAGGGGARGAPPPHPGGPGPPRGPPPPGGGAAPGARRLPPPARGAPGAAPVPALDRGPAGGDRRRGVGRPGRGAGLGRVPAAGRRRGHRPVAVLRDRGAAQHARLVLAGRGGEPPVTVRGRVAGW